MTSHQVRTSSAAERVTAYFHGKPISKEFQLHVEANPARIIEQAYFTLRLAKSPDGGLSNDPVFTGLYSEGRRSQDIPGWIDGDYFDDVSFHDTRFSLSMKELHIQLFKTLGDLVNDGGSLMVSYSLFSRESQIHKETKIGLDRGYPPIVTPLGFLLYQAGCGMGFKDWYFAEGGREGPEKLQGFKPVNAEFAKKKAEATLRELAAFSEFQGGDAIAKACKERGAAVIRELGG